MQILPIDLTSLVATILGISIVLIPVIGLTARFALKPTVEALGRLLEHKGLDDTLHLLERRLELQEQLIEALQDSVGALAAEHPHERGLSSAPRAALEAVGAASPTAEEAQADAEAAGMRADPSASRSRSAHGPAARAPDGPA